MPRRLPTLPPTGLPDLSCLPPAMTHSVGFLANQVASRIRARFGLELERHDLVPRDYLLLLVLHDAGAMAQQALGARAGMDRTTTMQAAQALEEAGLLERNDDPNDRRVYRLALTAAGRRLVGTLEGRLRVAEQEVLGALRPAERTQLVRLLRSALDLRDARGE